MRKGTLPCLFLSAVLILLAHATTNAQGWKVYQSDRHKVKFSLPTNWSCNYEKDEDGEEGIVGRSPDKVVEFDLSVEKVDDDDDVPNDPAQLKKLVEDYIKESMGDSNDSEIDLKSKDIAVESIHNLRGVVTEIVVITPEKDASGDPILKKTAAFILIAKKDNLLYLALVQCPFGKFDYYSPVMNRIISDIWAYDPVAEANQRAINAVAGVWLLSRHGGMYEDVLSVNGTYGIMRAWWRDAQGKLIGVDQTMKVQITPQGVLLIGSDPVYAKTKTPYTTYAADKLIFQRQTDNSYKIWTKDDVNVKEWEAVTVKSHISLQSIRAIKGIWELSHSNVESVISIKGIAGVMRVRYVDSNHQTMVVDQIMTLQSTPQGLFLIGSTPTIAGTQTPVENYAPDKLLFQQQSDGSFKVWTRDDVYLKEWTPVTVKSHRSN